MTTSQSAHDGMTEQELNEVIKANASGLAPVVFVHGLWLLSSSWDRWAELFRSAGYATLQPGWPDDPDTAEQANADPEVFAGKKIGQIADHYDGIIRSLDRKPAVIGHSSAACSPRSSPAAASPQRRSPSTQLPFGGCYHCRSPR